MMNIGWKPVDNNYIKGGKKMLMINNIAKVLQENKQKIYDNEKYYTSEWKKDKLKELKVMSVKAYQSAIEEFQNVYREYENKIKELESARFNGHSSSKEFIESVNFTKSRLLAEIKVNPYEKDKIIDNALSSRIGSQAILEMIQNKELDSSHWTDEVFKKAFINSKSQAELDFEINKESEIEKIKKERDENCNYGSYLGAIKVLNGDIKKGIPTLEKSFDDEILEVDRNE